MEEKMNQVQQQQKKAQILAEAAASGDRIARDELLLMLTPMIVRAAAFAARATGDRDDAVQDGYLRMLALIDRYDPAAGVCFLRYAKIQLRYFYANRTRYEQRRRHLSLDVPCSPDDPTPMADTLPGDPVDFDAAETQRAKNVRFGQAMAQLSPAEREVITLALKGHDNRTIARILGKGEKTIRNLKSLAKKKLT